MPLTKSLFLLIYTSDRRKSWEYVTTKTIQNLKSKNEQKKQTETKVNRKKYVLNLEQKLKWWRALHTVVSSPSAALILLFCSSFFTSHSLSRLLLRFALLPSQARAGLLLGFLCFAKANQCCSKATLLCLLP